MFLEEARANGEIESSSEEEEEEVEIIEQLIYICECVASERAARTKIRMPAERTPAGGTTLHIRSPRRGTTM